MPPPTQGFVRNRLLSALSEQAYAEMRPHLEACQFERGELLIEQGRAITHVHFLDRGIGSILASTPSGGSVETGLFGRDGMSGTSLVLGTERAVNTTLIQVAGSGYRIEADALREAITRSPALLATLLRYIQTLVTQTSYTALSNVNQPVEQRLARWLLMCHDRIDGNHLALTHEFLAIMLAVHRPSVTTALHVLEGNQFIKATRGHIEILNREGLIQFADGSYGIPEAEYERLFGPLR